MIALLALGLMAWAVSSTKEAAQKPVTSGTRNRKRFTGELHNKVVQIARRLGLDVEILYGIMNFETMYTLNPQIKNGINCGGLIGFCPVHNGKYIDGSLVGQPDNLLTKSASYQLDYVEKFFRDNIKTYGVPKNKVEMYLMVFHPASLRHVHKPDHIVGSEVSMTWAKAVAQQNAKAFLDSNGYVTIRSISKAIHQFI
mgnify:FL=1